MAKRISLREFQQGLSERLVSARRGEGAQALLGIESGSDDLPGGSHWLIDPGPTTSGSSALNRWMNTESPDSVAAA